MIQPIDSFILPMAVAALVLLAGCGTSARMGASGPARPAGAEQWRFECQRDEIAPKSWRDERVRYRGRATLALAGGGKAFAAGQWVRAVPIRPAEHYRFEACFRAEDVDEPQRCVLARIVWLDGRGKQVGRAEYPATLRRKTRSGWSVIRQTYAAPKGAAAAKLELVYRWDGDGTVRFSPARLDPVAPPAPRPVRLATVHLVPKRTGSSRANLELFADLIAKAAARKADIVCLPEGITVVGTKIPYVKAAEPIPGPSSRFLGRVAKKHRLYIVAGIYERQGAAAYNTTILIGRDGRVAGKYRKVCLPREEIQGGLAPGEAFPVFQTDFGRVGIMVCWDSTFPEAARALARGGAEVILLPIWGGNLTLVKARAIENQVYVVTSSYNMKSAVFDQEGKVLAEATSRKRVVVVEVDLGKQRLLPWLGDMKNRIPREMPSARSLVPRP